MLWWASSISDGTVPVARHDMHGSAQFTITTARSNHQELSASLVSLLDLFEMLDGVRDFRSLLDSVWICL
jgi:hypothetical protein